MLYVNIGISYTGGCQLSRMLRQKELRWADQVLFAGMAAICFTLLNRMPEIHAKQAAVGGPV